MRPLPAVWATDGAAVLVLGWSAHDAEQHWGADPAGAEALVEELRAEGSAVEHLSADLASPDAPGALVQAARDAFGHLDIVVAMLFTSAAPCRPSWRMWPPKVPFTSSLPAWRLT